MATQSFSIWKILLHFGLQVSRSCRTLKHSLLFFRFHPDGSIGHACVRTQCTRGNISAECVACAASHARSVVSRRLLGLPEIGKWTKLGPVLDFYVLYMVGHLLCNAAKFTFRDLATSKLAEWVGDLDPDFISQIGWRRVAGVRCGRLWVSLEDASLHARILMISFVSESFRHITAYFMKASNRDWSSIEPIGCKENPNWAFDLLKDEFSLLICAREYFSSICFVIEDWHRLSMLLGARGCTNFSELCERYPDDMRLLVRLILCADASLERRLVRGLKTRFGLLQIGDLSVGDACKENIIAESLKKNVCCRSACVERYLCQQAEDHVSRSVVAGEIDQRSIPDHLREKAEYLKGTSWALAYVAWSLLVSIACMERLHAVHNRILSFGQGRGFHHMCAASLVARHSTRHDAASKKETNIDNNEITRPLSIGLPSMLANYIDKSRFFSQALFDLAWQNN
jgi:hypothetical protein